MSRQILLCTVGGSHEPILEAIRSSAPDYTCFFCTGRDPETGRPGSDVQITGKGKVIKVAAGDKKPTLPNIPTQAELSVGSYKAKIIPADDLDDAFSKISKTIADLVKDHTGAKFVADYTGGTKTMSTALVLAALESDNVELQLVSGARSDLNRVESGNEQAMSASVTHIRLNREMELHLAAWDHFAYREAATGLDGIRVAANSPDRGRLGIARALSHGLALWDDFDHAGANKKLGNYKKHMNKCHLRALSLLTQTRKPGNQPAQLFDLWLNAQRRAGQGRYDDAVARVYRLLEWCAQWQLKIKKGIDTVDLPPEMAPDGAKLGRNDRISVGLWQAWQVVHKQLDGPASEFIEQHGAAFENLLQTRNHSILAHGFDPVRKDDWERMSQWLEQNFLPVLLALAQQVDVFKMPEQLPIIFPQITQPD